ncbi:MAG: glycosyltransferase family 4 protein [Pseudomonadota bacterium]|nr:glycosyltransferase family 4 protein [Pseudomonadota bacterium]
MRILYINFDRGVPVLGDKGASVHVRAMTTGLARLGHDVTLLCSRLGGTNAPPPAHLVELAPPRMDAQALESEAHLSGLTHADLADPIVAREIATLAHDRALPARTLAVLADMNWFPDIVYERHALFHTAGATLAAMLGAPRIVEVNAPLAREQALHRGLALRGIADAREAYSWREADLAVAVSAEVRGHLLACGVDPARAMVAQNGVDTSLFRVDPGQAARTRLRWGLGGGPVVGFVGSFKLWHGVAALIDAFARVQRDWPEARLLAVGDGPALESCRAQAAALGLAGAAAFTGAVPHADIPMHLAAMDFTVAPYAPDPDFYFSPLKIVESLAAGCPVVAPRLGQIEALVEHEATGLLYAPGDDDQLVAAMTRLLREAALRRRLGSDARARMHASWDWTQVASRILGRLAAAGPLAEETRA